MRHPDWEKRLNAVLERHRDQPGVWGKSDCFVMAMDAHLAVTGRKILSDLRSYKTERGGYRLFAKHGFTTVGLALASVLEKTGRFTCHRGDLCVVERDGVEACGVVSAGGVAVKAQHGIEYVSLSDIKTAFKVC